MRASGIVAILVVVVDCVSISCGPLSAVSVLVIKVCVIVVVSCSSGTISILVIVSGVVSIS